MNQAAADTRRIAFCGLYCGACGKYLKEKCPGCGENEKATWCKVRTCCMERSYSSCADCREMEDVAACKKFNNLMSKIVGFVLRSDRKACIDRIRENGRERYSEEMARKNRMTIRR
ncbi:MAG: DUF3795 domain-containing protein [Candidatus Latescibacteria bacterium]|nr:DUF3795 domain-containing protein [Candidatus Latescibacterota bacterium]